MGTHKSTTLAISLSACAILFLYQSPAVAEDVLQTVRNNLDSLFRSIPTVARNTSPQAFRKKCEERKQALIAYIKQKENPSIASTHELHLGNIIGQMADCQESLASYLKSKEGTPVRSFINPKKYHATEMCEAALRDLTKINETYRTVFRGVKNIDGYDSVKAILKECDKAGDAIQPRDCNKIYEDCLAMYGTSMKGECFKMKRECEQNARK